MESVLNSIKKLLGPSAADDHFNPDIIMHINTVFMALKQIGVGPATGFSIEDELATWDEFVTDIEQYQAVKTYIYAKVKLAFDPPLSSTHIASLEKIAAECEWRLNVEAES